MGAFFFDQPPVPLTERRQTTITCPPSPPSPKEPRYRNTRKTKYSCEATNNHGER
jgi:hypothetical protein